MEPSGSRVRVVVVGVVAAVWLCGVGVRLGQLQLLRYADYLARAQRQQQRLIEVSPQRGILYDRNLRELAMSVTVESAFAVPSEIADPPMVARLLAGVLGTSPEEIETRLKSSRSFVWVARKLPAATAERIRELNLRGVYFQKENQRFYPQRELAAHVLGYVDIDERGLGGIEYAFDQHIRGRPGRLLVLADARRRWYDRSEEAPQPGAGVVLTLDQNIQYIVERELERAMRETRAQSGVIAVQDPASGELLALASWPRFNPNAARESRPEERMNRAVAALYEPGSIFKIVTIAGALEESLTRPQEIIDCQMGAIVISGHRIRDHKPFGLLSVTQVMAKSSDVGTIKLGLRLGAPRLHDYTRAFGFGRPTGIELPGESRGLLRRVEQWTPGSVGSISMGQEVGVTAVQMIAAMSAIANGGLYYPPRIVREVRHPGRPPETPERVPRRILSPATAATLRLMLEAVVLEGTGLLARLDGYTSGGKTGTAQKIDPATGRYSETDFIASYVGFAPLNNPAVTVLVTIDSPVGAHGGGTVAAPVFKRVTEQVLAYLDVPHDVRVTPAVQRAARRLAAQPPDVSDFAPAAPRVELAAAGGGLPLLPAEPPAGHTVAIEEEEGPVMPDLSGKSVRQVTEECLRLGLSPALIGSGIATEQYPEAGTRLRRGARVTVRFARTPPPAPKGG